MKNYKNEKSHRSNVASKLSLALCASLSASAYAELPANAVLAFNPGITGGYYNLVIGGSYYAMDVSGDGIFRENERTAIEMNDGIRLGEAQPASGSHTGTPDGSELPTIDKPWSFFGNTGMQQTTSPVVIVSNAGNTATLDFSGWGVTWNSIPNIPMGTGDSAGVATVICAVDCALGDSYTIDYYATVPQGDVSGFGGVKYMVHFEGLVSEGTPVIPTKGVTVELVGSDRFGAYECTSAAGSVIQANANIITADMNDIVSVDWSLDGTYVSSGQSLSTNASLGEHTLTVSLTTIASGNFDSDLMVNVADKKAPTLDVVFRDKRTGAAVTQVSSGRKSSVVIDYVVTDVCDPAASATGVAVPVHMVADGDTLSVTNLPTSAINVSAVARDNAGNTRPGSATLKVVD